MRLSFTVEVQAELNQHCS